MGSRHVKVFAALVLVAESIKERRQGGLVTTCLSLENLELKGTGINA